VDLSTTPATPSILPWYCLKIWRNRSWMRECRNNKAAIYRSCLRTVERSYARSDRWRRIGEW
jgi:hypothetical protein